MINFQNILNVISYLYFVPAKILIELQDIVKQDKLKTCKKNTNKRKWHEARSEVAI